MQDVDYIICGDYVLPMDEGLTVIKDGAIDVRAQISSKLELLKRF